MRSMYIGLVAVFLSWTGVLASESNKAIPNEALLARRPRVLQNRHRNGTADYAQLGLRQEGGRCGAGVGRCPGGQCCSDYGFCGLTVDHCHPLFDCQAQYGVCGWPPPVPATTSTPPPPPTTTSQTSTSTPPPPPPTTSTTAPPPPPTTTSTTALPPPTTASTSVIVIPLSSTSSRPPIPEPTIPLGVTTNGQCGNSTMCIGNPNYGPCCSQYFWCGSSIEFCGAGCQSNFGACLGIPGLPGTPINGTTTSTSPVVPPTTTSTPVVVPPTTTSTTSTTSTSTSTTSTTTTSTTTTSTTSTRTTFTTTSAAPTPTLVLPPGQRSSTDGRCGSGQNCLGSNFGRCCSQFGWCGDGDQYCPYIVGCQPDFGYCDPR